MRIRCETVHIIRAQCLTRSTKTGELGFFTILKQTEPL